MGSHPINLAVRFILELAALGIMGFWGWRQTSGLPRFLLALGIPLVAAAIWGIFRVPGDPGPAPVAVPGLVRLAYELVFFGFAAWALYDLGYITRAAVFALITVVHYILSYDRILWLLRR